MKVVNNIGIISNTAQYNTVVIPAFNQGNQLLNLRVVEQMKNHQYTLTSKWLNTTGEEVHEATNADGTQNYSKMGSFIDTRTVETIAKEIQRSDKSTPKEEKYATGILGEISK